jgi:hypothetical protein
MVILSNIVRQVSVEAMISLSFLIEAVRLPEIEIDSFP